MEQYKLIDSEALSKLLLSPRAHVKNGSYMTCKPCYKNIVNNRIAKPQRFAISNNWCIGQLPNDLIDGDIEDILVASIAKVRFFSNVYSYTAGAHKAIKGHHVFFLNDPEHVGATFEYMVKEGAAPDMYVMICGRVTPAQRDIIKRRCTIDTDDYKTVLNWLIDNHPSYKGMERPQCCPEPIVMGGFEQTTNNTDESEESMPEVENVFEGEKMTYAPRHEPSASTGPYQSEKQFIFSYLQQQKPTLLFRCGDHISGHHIDLIDLFPLTFPYGWGGPNQERATRVSKSAILRHYCRIALPQMQQSQFLLVLCTMWQRMESFTKCIISCKSSFKSSTSAEKLLELRPEEIKTAARHILNGEQTSNPTLKKLFTSIRGQSSSLGHSNEAASFARHKLFSLWHYFGAPAVFFTVTPCDECSFRVRLYATCQEHKLLTLREMENQNKCLLEC